MISGTAKQKVRSILRDDNSSPPDLSLRAIVDACVSNVAVLDESGSIVYASKAWDVLERNFAEKTGAAPLFESCKRFTESEPDEESDISLADDIQSILVGKQKEFHRKYYFHSLPESRPFVMHAARLNLPELTFRVLITHEELPSVREYFSDGKERLLDVLGAKILAWEGEVEGQRFSYVSEHAVEMLGYPVTRRIFSRRIFTPTISTGCWPLIRNRPGSASTSISLFACWRVTAGSCGCRT
jgi:hypothetical protein